MSRIVFYEVDRAAFAAVVAIVRNLELLDVFIAVNGDGICDATSGRTRRCRIMGALPKISDVTGGVVGPVDAATVTATSVTHTVCLPQDLTRTMWLPADVETLADSAVPLVTAASGNESSE
jgi:hypothetical protein